MPPAGLCKAGGEAERAPRFVIFLEAAKNADAQRVFRKISESMVYHYPPRAYAKRVARPSEPPALYFFGSRQNAHVPRVFRKISKSMVDHCPPRAYAKRGPRPNEPPALEFFWRPQKC